MDPLHLQIANLLQKAGPLSTREIEKRLGASGALLHRPYVRATALGWIRLVRKATRGRKAHAAIYEAGEIRAIPTPDKRTAKPVPVFSFRASCVWDLAVGRSVEIKPCKGRQFAPLGEW